MAALEQAGPDLGPDRIERSGLTIEQVYESDQRGAACAVEIAYQGTYRLEEAILDAPEKLGDKVAGLASWIASALVRLADLELPFLPPDGEVDAPVE
jgi:lipid A disaccharide synthetase